MECVNGGLAGLDNWLGSWTRPVGVVFKYINIYSDWVLEARGGAAGWFYVEMQDLDPEGCELKDGIRCIYYGTQPPDYPGSRDLFIQGKVYITPDGRTDKRIQMFRLCTSPSAQRPTSPSRTAPACQPPVYLYLCCLTARKKKKEKEVTPPPWQADSPTHQPHPAVPPPSARLASTTISPAPISELCCLGR